MIDPNGNVFASEYDQRGYQTALHFPDGSSVTYQYNDQRKKIAETDQLGQTKQFAWNPLGLLHQLTDPSGYTTTYAYNAIGNLLAQTDANGHTGAEMQKSHGFRNGQHRPGRSRLNSVTRLTWRSSRAAQSI